jgi:hypothetical protein
MGGHRRAHSPDAVPSKRTSMRRHYLSRPTWRPRCSDASFPPDAPSPRFHSHSRRSRDADRVHDGVRPLGARRCYLGSALSGVLGGQQVRLRSHRPGAIERLAVRSRRKPRSSARRRPCHASLLVWPSSLLFSPPVSPPLCGVGSQCASGVVKRLVGLPGDPQPMQSSTESLRATATAALLLAFLPPRSAIFRPWRLRSESWAKGPST